MNALHIRTVGDIVSRVGSHLGDTLTFQAVDAAGQPVALSAQEAHVNLQSLSITLSSDALFAAGTRGDPGEVGGLTLLANTFGPGLPEILADPALAEALAAAFARPGPPEPPFGGSLDPTGGSFNLDPNRDGEVRSARAARGRRRSADRLNRLGVDRRAIWGARPAGVELRCDGAAVPAWRPRPIARDGERAARWLSILPVRGGLGARRRAGHGGGAALRQRRPARAAAATAARRAVPTAAAIEAARRFLCPHGGTPMRGGRCRGGGATAAVTGRDLSVRDWDAGLPGGGAPTGALPRGHGPARVLFWNDAVRCLPR